MPLCLFSRRSACLCACSRFASVPLCLSLSVFLFISLPKMPDYLPVDHRACLFACVCLCACLPLLFCLPVYLSTRPPAYMSLNFRLYTSLPPSLVFCWLSICPSGCSYDSLSSCLPASLINCLFVGLSVCLTMHHSVHLSVWLSTSPPFILSPLMFLCFVCLSNYVPVCLPVCLPVFVSVSLFSRCLHAILKACLCMCTSVCLYARLSVSACLYNCVRMHCRSWVRVVCVVVRVCCVACLQLFRVCRGLEALGKFVVVDDLLTCWSYSVQKKHLSASNSSFPVLVLL